jgi:hypothetical protein
MMRKNSTYAPSLKVTTTSLQVNSLVYFFNLVKRSKTIEEEGTYLIDCLQYFRVKERKALITAFPVTDLSGAHN